MHQYFPHTQADIDKMLACCGVESLEDLYSDVPAECRIKKPYDLPEGKSEKELRDFFNACAEKLPQCLTCFAGGGFYHHYAPSVIANLISRSEFLTAYTPYQPEISQGTLQYIFEYQSIIAELTGLEVSNASMYDGATATAEAMIMCVASARKKNRVLISATLDPIVTKVVRTYASYRGVDLTVIPEKEGVTDLEKMEELLQKGDVAGVILPQPNRYGIIEDLEGVADKIHAVKALMVMNCVASTLAVLRTPAEWGADIAVGDGRSLGMPLNYGGPSLGFMCTKKSLMRKMPGRIVGATKDKDGQRCFVLTLQAREQHIRREKATSNICSNQGVMSLYVTMYVALMGPKGLEEVNQISEDGAHYLAAELVKTGKCALSYPDKEYLNEFALNCNFDVDRFLQEALKEGIQAGLKIGDNQLLIAVTEMQTPQEMDRLVALVNKQ